MDFGFINLHPTAWTQSLHTKRGAAFRLGARLDTRSAFKIEGVVSVAGLPTEVGFTRGITIGKFLGDQREQSGF
jgi:hypothetical protein